MTYLRERLRDEAVAERLRQARPVMDAEFDGAYPSEVRRLSSPFWTPVLVALRASALLAAGPDKRILDIGSGPGKFCIVGALSTGATFDGVEHRPALVDLATATAERYGATRARFACGVFNDLDPREYDGFYLFNPFEENLFEPEARVDEAVALSVDRYMRDVTAARVFLTAARPGARIVTYHGFGGAPPSTYDHSLRERCGSAHLDLWEQTARPPRGLEVVRTPPRAPD